MIHPHSIDKPTILPEPIRRHLLLGMALLAGSSVAGAPLAVGSEPTTVLVLGDSIAAEYGIARGSGWVALLADRAGERVRFTNASISGETTSGGRTRLPGLLAEHRPDVVIIELGANDALRGLQLEASEENLDAMVGAARAADAGVLVLGMQVPPNYGRRYTERFAAMFETVAKRHRVALVPFLLDSIATDLGYFQDDRIHPNESAQPLIAETVWPVLSPLLGRTGTAHATTGRPVAGARDRDRTGKAG